jgi:hypothetical protein
MVISYIYSTCWCMKSTFYESQQWLCALDWRKENGIGPGGLCWATRPNGPKPAGENRKENRMVWFVGWSKLME